MVRDYKKVIAKTLSSYRWYRDTETVKTYLGTVGVAEGILNRGVPVLQAYAEWMRTQGTVRLHTVEGEWKYRNLNMDKDEFRSMDISFETRESFERAFGVSPVDQVLLEQNAATLGNVPVFRDTRHTPLA